MPLLARGYCHWCGSVHQARGALCFGGHGYAKEIGATAVFENSMIAEAWVGQAATKAYEEVDFFVLVTELETVSY